MSFKFLSIFYLIALVQKVTSLVEKDSKLQQLHRYWDDGYYSYPRFGGWLSGLIISVIVGILCFLAIMYFCKWRREGTFNLPFFGNRNIPQQQYVIPTQQAYGAYPQAQPTYGASPYGGYQHHQASYNPNNPQYPAV